MQMKLKCYHFQTEYYNKMFFVTAMVNTQKSIKYTQKEMRRKSNHDTKTSMRHRRGKE